MKATANSNIISPINIHMKIIIRVVLLQLLPKSLIKICPAIILALNRTAKDPGRIIFLIVSIITINGISIYGVPIGTKWENIWLVLLIHPYIINAIHIDRANDKENTRCEDAVNT